MLLLGDHRRDCFFFLLCKYGCRISVPSPSLLFITLSPSFPLSLSLSLSLSHSLSALCQLKHANAGQLSVTLQSWEVDGILGQSQHKVKKHYYSAALWRFGTVWVYSVFKGKRVSALGSNHQNFISSWAHYYVYLKCHWNVFITLMRCKAAVF